ncbi:MAG: glycosyltransferase family 9 protein [Gammaproteobacteria bacterium]|nr:glycosyltransferase family 9 protein [Gammaproteobacteria bacterium]
MSVELGRWSDARRILCVRLDNIGDVLMTTPALRALRESAPGRRIALLAARACAELLPLIPEVDEAIVYDAPWVGHAGEDPGPAADATLIEALRGARFDAAAIFTVYSQSALPAALACRLAGIPLRLAHARENPYRLLSHWVAETEPQAQVRHEVRRQLDLVAAVGAAAADERLSFAVQARHRLRAQECLLRLGVAPDSDWVLVHPGASAPSRRYPAELFAAAATLLHRALGCPIVFGGNAAEVPLVNAIRRAARAPMPSLAGALDLAEYGAAIGLARIMVSNNSGPVHIAAALGTPVVDLYALTNPQHAPWGVPHRVLSHDVPCKYCYRSVCPQGHHACLRGVAPHEVAAAAIELFRGGRPRRRPCSTLPDGTNRLLHQQLA